MASHNTSSHTISCIVLTYNHEKYIHDCLVSILECDFQPMHIWVLDDGSTDGTCGIIEQLAQTSDRITLLTQPNSGGLTAANTQRLLDESHGDYVLFMSGDDMLGPSFPLTRTMQALNADPRLDLVLPRLLFLTQDPTQQTPLLYTPALLDILRSNDPQRVLHEHLYCSVSRIFLQGIVIRRSVVRDIGGFDTTLKADDYAFIMRLFKHMVDTGHYFHFDERSLWLYRLHDSNIHRASLRQFQLIAEVAAKYIPKKYWKGFRWDCMVFNTSTDLQIVHETTIRLFGPAYRSQLLWRTECVTLRAARQRGDMRLILQILFAARTAAISRLYALFSILVAVWARVLQGRM